MTGGCTTTALAYGGKGANAALCHGATTVSRGTLPFTGFDLAAIAVVAVLLILAGLLALRAGRVS